MELNIPEETELNPFCDKTIKTPEEQKPKEDSKLSSVMKVFALDYTTAHGLPNIYKARSTFGRLLWTVLFFGGSIAVLVQMYFLMDRYFSYNTATEVSLFVCLHARSICGDTLGF